MNSEPGARSLAFPKARRLTRPAEFLRVKTEGKTERGALLIVGILQAAEAGPFRAGFVTSKRVGGAVTRNRIRRRLREIVRTHQHEIPPGLWVVIVAKSRAAGADYQALESEWLRLMQRAVGLHVSR